MAVSRGGVSQPGGREKSAAARGTDPAGGRGNGGGGGGGGQNPTANPNVTNPNTVGNPVGNQFGNVGSGFGSGPGTQGPPAPGQQPNRAAAPPEDSGLLGALDPTKPFTGDPVLDAMVGIIGALTPLGYGIGLTKALQAMGVDSVESDVDNNQRGSATGQDGGNNPGNTMFGGQQDSTTGNTTNAPQAANAEAVNVNAGSTVNTEVGRILQQQQQQAAQRRRTALTGGGAQGLSGPANTAGVSLFGA